MYTISYWSRMLAPLQQGYSILFHKRGSDMPERYDRSEMYWKSLDGRKFRLDKMTVEHIVKIVKILRFGYKESRIKNGLPVGDWISIFKYELKHRNELSKEIL